jgi:Ser/Thr protein kinase RdoA (MazF antagonist)
MERLTGGVPNDVWSVRLDGQLVVGRLGRRSAAELAWEAGLMRHLDRAGIAVPLPIPTRDGRFPVDGLMVMTFAEGGSPETAADWAQVAEVLGRVHSVTQGWPQRPGWQSSVELLTETRGTRVDLAAMPGEAVARCRTARAKLAGRETTVVHGNPANPGNFRMTADRVALIDWDEARVDVPDLDLVLPCGGGLRGAARDVAEQAQAAWEAAVCWDDDHARRRLAEVRAV